MNHFRPISLCNVIFKIVSKVLANRLKLILGSIIFECQSAFVANRIIIDNILISFETLHYMKTKRQGKTTHMALKLDMSKAYDRVEWDYLKASILKMGFHKKWLDLIMAGSYLFLTRYWLMGHLPNLLNPREAFAKEILCLLTCFYCALKDSRHY